MTRLFMVAVAYVLLGIACVIRVFPNGWESINTEEFNEIINIGEDDGVSPRIFASTLLGVIVFVWPLLLIRWLLFGE